jgi:hypothetical protein
MSERAEPGIIILVGEQGTTGKWGGEWGTQQASYLSQSSCPVETASQKCLSGVSKLLRILQGQESYEAITIMIAMVGKNSSNRKKELGYDFSTWHSREGSPVEDSPISLWQRETSIGSK